MSEQHKQWIGIDVCQDYLDIAIHPEGKTFRLAVKDQMRWDLALLLADYGGRGWIKVDGLVRAILVGVGEMDCFYI
jgi:hypothetical protein